MPEVTRARHRDPAVAPRLRTQPGDGVEAILLLQVERPELATGTERPPRASQDRLQPVRANVAPKIRPIRPLRPYGVRISTTGRGSSPGTA
ncbi:hypothetical protein AOZ06_46550 [Kibdelosporangium phytohabitans]|uniref:Uncharacterized protein n=1 Tax=Kibdelosporangium phytohabitans TaxID=860235 RepID=A0A0N9IEW7_9PSEU|nr:hypothetical protein AOZ06_46550 [Kibdelosporangium phytohabitans]